MSLYELEREKRAKDLISHLRRSTSVETHVSGPARQVTILESLVNQGQTRDAEDLDVTDRERQVLVALYSGVSPFEVPDFVGMDVEAVEETFDSLAEKGVLTEKRVRREVIADQWPAARRTARVPAFRDGPSRSRVAPRTARCSGVPRRTAR